MYICSNENAWISNKIVVEYKFSVCKFGIAHKFFLIDFQPLLMFLYITQGLDVILQSNVFVFWNELLY